MASNITTFLRVTDYRVTIPKEQLVALQQALERAARAGQSPQPFVAGQELSAFLLETWCVHTFSNRAGHALTTIHIPSWTSVQMFDTFLSLIAPFISMEHPAYFEVTVQSEDGDREFFYHFQNGRVWKEERICSDIPAELDIKPLFPGSGHEDRDPHEIEKEK